MKHPEICEYEGCEGLACIGCTCGRWVCIWHMSFSGCSFCVQQQGGKIASRHPIPQKGGA